MSKSKQVANLVIKPIDYILTNDLGYCEGLAITLISAWKGEGGVDDLRRAIHYLNLLIEDNA